MFGCRAVDETMTWKDVDWIRFIGGTSAKLLGGRPGIVLSALLELRADAQREVSDKVEAALPPSRADVLPDAQVLADIIGLSDLDSTAVRCVFAIARSRSCTSAEDVEVALDELAIAVWRDSTELRSILSSTAYDGHEIRLLCRDAGLEMGRLHLDGSAERQWFSIFEYLRTQFPARLLLLLFVASERYPAEFRLRFWDGPHE